MLENFQYLNDEDGTHGGVSLSYACITVTCHHSPLKKCQQSVPTNLFLVIEMYLCFGWD